MAERYTAINYFGGKWRLAPKLVARFPQHRIYLEPFIGSAAVLMAKQPSPVEVISDIDPEVINLHRVIRDNPLWLMADATDDHDKDFFDRYLKGKQDPRQWDKALAMCSPKLAKIMRARIRLAWRGKFTGAHISHTFAYKPYQWKRVLDRLPQQSERLRGVEIYHSGYAAMLRLFDSPDTFVYLDPPYIDEARQRGDKQYDYEMLKVEEHIPLLEMVVRLRARVMISGYAHWLYDQYLRGWTKQSFATKALCGGPNNNSPDRHRTEVIWTNY